MTRNFSNMPRRASTPRRAKAGAKLAHDLAVLRQHAGPRRWIDAVEHMLPPEECQLGATFAQQAMVQSIEVRAGLIEGVVQVALPMAASPPPTGAPHGAQGSFAARAATSCTVRIHVPRHNEETWQEALASLSNDGSAVAPLLAGELPGDLDDLLARHGAPLAPRRHELIKLECTCDADALCRHVAALTWLFADRLHADPALALQVRGVTADEFLDRVRHVRAAAARRASPAATAHADAATHAALSETSLDEFWRTGPELDDLAQLPPSTHAPHALLRRLGPSPLGGTFPLVGLLASAYDTIKAHAEKLRDSAEEVNE